MIHSQHRCSACHASFDIIFDDNEDTYLTDVDENDDDFDPKFSDDFEIKFCPFCGEDL